MKLFLDTAEIEEIRTVHAWGVLDGVTTNPTLFSKIKGRTYEEVLQEICRITSGPVSAEVVAEDVDGMLREGRHYAKLADNIYVKVPMSETGLEAISRFRAEGIRTNCTLISRPTRACSRPRPARRSCRRSSDGSTTSTRRG